MHRNRPQAATSAATRRLGWGAALAVAMACCASPAAADLEVVVDRSSGEVFFKNGSAPIVLFDGYELASATGALIGANWTPIADNYDLSGDQSVDSLSDWIVITTPDPTLQLSEASLTASSGSLAPDQVVSLGTLFDTSHAEILAVTVSNGIDVSQIVGDFRSLEADYDGDLDVDLDDYGVFSSTFGSTVDLRADGNGDNIIDAADYTVWRDSPELVLPSFAIGLVTHGAPLDSFALTVPEPASAVATLFAIAISSGPRRRRPAGRRLAE